MGEKEMEEISERFRPFRSLFMCKPQFDFILSSTPSLFTALGSRDSAFAPELLLPAVPVWQEIADMVIVGRVYVARGGDGCQYHGVRPRTISVLGISRLSRRCGLWFVWLVHVHNGF